MIGSNSTAEPDFSLALARITRMSKDELNELLNKEEKVEEYIKSLDQVSEKFILNGKNSNFDKTFCVKNES